MKLFRTAKALLSHSRTRRQSADREAEEAEVRVVTSSKQQVTIKVSAQLDLD